ncbi:hypothetical protein BTR23_18655 [Alkalihalophilus pseudofirmus]|nr:hypothetical protein BTR23_18655 [Alkalihalophilus pseudofirmus]
MEDKPKRNIYKKSLAMEVALVVAFAMYVFNALSNEVTIEKTETFEPTETNEVHDVTEEPAVASNVPTGVETEEEYMRTHFKQQHLTS